MKVNEPGEASAAGPPEQGPASRQTLRPRLRLSIGGQSVRLRRLHPPRKGMLRWLAILGPGLVAGAVGDDAGGIATYSQAGAQYGYELLWVIVLITVSLAVVQEMSARLGAATGRGLLDLIRERFGIRWAVFAVAVIIIANGSLVLSEFAGIGAAAELFGVSRYVAIPVAAILVWAVVVAGSYGRVEKGFILMAAAFLAYPIAAVLAHPDWGQVAKGALVPRIGSGPGAVALLVGLIGTTISPYQQLFEQSATVEKGVARHHYGPERADTYVGAIFSNLVSAFIIIATGATLHRAGTTNIGSAADAAKALAPVAGPAAGVLFGVGLVGASLMAAAVLPIATAYAVSEAFGYPKGVGLDFRRAPLFFGLFTVLIALGAGLALIPGLPVIQLLIGVQILNSVLLPVILVFMLLLANDTRLMDDLKNTRVHNILGWGTAGLIVAAVLIMLVQYLA